MLIRASRYLASGLSFKLMVSNSSFAGMLAPDDGGVISTSGVLAQTSNQY